jgi:hypothetical protein
MSRPDRAFRVLPAVVLLTLVALPAAAQVRRDRNWDRCSDWGGDRDMEQVCNLIDTTIPAPAGTLFIDGRTNGGITIFGSSRRDILVRAKISANARSRERAEALAEAIKIHTDGNRISADGPDNRGREWWSVEFEVEVPAHMDLDLRAHNGGISVADVTGTLRMETENGGIHLESVNGDVVAETANGGLHVELDGDGWVGKGLDAVTTNGGVHVQVARGYSAHLETGTVNGGVDIDFPVTVQGKIGRRISTDLGKGGPTVRVITTNGGVDIRRGL